ncbi:MAG: hypothetical protein PVG79_06575 [Gemmatimonadales bacterium]|jgi:hypothetical protein
MESKLPEAARLIQEALSGPPGLTELRTESGQLVRVERDPEPGIQLRLVFPGSEERRDPWTALAVPPVADRPESYPSSVPFLPGVETIVVVFGEVVNVVWHPSGAACQVPDIEPDEKLEELERRLKSVRETAVGADAESRPEACVSFKAIIDSLGPELREKLEQVWRHMQPAPEIMYQLERTFEDAAAASLAEGWRLVDRKETEMPVRALNARFERDAYSRQLFMMALSRSVMLVQHSRESGVTEAPTAARPE